MVYAYPPAFLGLLVWVVFEFGFYSWFFSRNLKVFFALLIPAMIRFSILCRRFYEKKQKELEGEFRECIMSVATGLRAGYSVENSFEESIVDMRMMFGEKSRIVEELQKVCVGLKNNISLENLLGEFGERSGSVLIKEFADILTIASKSGGDMTEIIANTAECMEEQNRVISEIEVIVSGRKLEGKIMSLIPFLLAFYVQLTNPGYFDMFYKDVLGRVVMSVCLGTYLAAVFLIEKILEIEK